MLKKMNVIPIISKEINSTQVCPTSKSYANRALILAALNQETISLTGMPHALDVEDLIENFQKLGLVISKKTNEVIVAGSFPKNEPMSSEVIELPGSEGGTTVRFLAVLLALGNNTYKLKLKGSLASRPMNDLLLTLIELGASASINDKYLMIRGPIDLSKEVTINCADTTQFATAFILLKSIKKIKLKLLNLDSSLAYIDMSEAIVKNFLNITKFEVPYDASSLGYFIAYGIVNQNLDIENVYSIDYLQADSFFFTLMDRLNIKYVLSDKGLSIFQNKSFHGFVVDGRECIDLIPTLIYLACFAKSKSEFSNLKYLVHKESNRLDEMLKILRFFNGDFSYNESKDILEIYPTKLVYDLNSKFKTADDHRMVMVYTLFLKTLEGGKIYNPDCVSKSFPDFFTRF